MTTPKLRSGERIQQHPGYHEGFYDALAGEPLLDWMLRTPDLEPDFKWNARRELDRRAA